MQNKKKNKKLTEGEGFTLAQEQPLGLSIGALLGVPQKERSDENEEKKAEPQSARGAKAEAAAPPKICAPRKKPAVFLRSALRKKNAVSFVNT